MMPYLISLPLTGDFILTPKEEHLTHHVWDSWALREGQLENGDKLNWEAPNNGLQNPGADAGVELEGKG